MTDPNIPSQPSATPPSATPYSAGGPAPERSTNVLAIIALIGAFVFPLAGIICGHIALAQIKRTGEAGQPLALWGTILGYVFSVIWILIFLFAIILPVLIFGSAVSQIPDLNY